MLTFAYGLDGDSSNSIKDLPLDTLVNYQNAVGSNGYKKGDLVYLNAGLLRRSKDIATPPKAIGILEGLEFLGMVGQGQPYAATNASVTADAVNTTKYPNGVGKVRIYNDAVYRIPLKAAQTATNANIGVSYGIFQNATTGDQQLDLTNTANPQLKVVGFSGNNAFVLLNSNPTI